MPVLASLLVLAALSPLGPHGPDPGSAPAGGAAPAPSAAPAVPTCEPGQRYRPPVAAPVTDPFRAPATPFGPGNRGVEYGTTPGQTIRAIGAGVVSFAGSVGGSRYVTVAHPDGLRSSYSFLAQILVAEGQVVASGQAIGRAAARFHVGVRCGDVYVDPAALIGAGAGRWRARLVPDSRLPPP